MNKYFDELIPKIEFQNEYFQFVREFEDDYKDATLPFMLYSVYCDTHKYYELFPIQYDLSTFVRLDHGNYAKCDTEYRVIDYINSGRGNLLHLRK